TKEIGLLTAKMIINLGSYAGAPVAVRLDDTDTQPIAQLDLATLPAIGHAGNNWQVKSKGDGLQLVQLKELGPTKPGLFKLTVKAKHWFTAAEANQSAAGTTLTVTVGGQCFTHAATKKVS